MEKQNLIDQLNEIEKLMHISLPSEYKCFIIENVKYADFYEIQRANGDQLYVSIVLICLKEIMHMQSKRLSLTFY